MQLLIGCLLSGRRERSGSAASYQVTRGNGALARTDRVFEL
jgi:hypothetical protein